MFRYLVIGLFILSFLLTSFLSADYHDSTRVLLKYDGDPPTSAGITSVDNTDGHISELTAYGVHLLNGSSYFYYAVDDSYIPYSYHSNLYDCTNVFISIRCWNTSSYDIDIQIQYDAGPNAPYQATEKKIKVVPIAPLTYEIVTFCLPIASFRNRQTNGADFRIVPTCSNPSEIENLYIQSVSVSRAAGPYIEPITETYSLDSFDEEQPLVGTVLFPWYDVVTGYHIKSDDWYPDNDMLSLHPSIEGLQTVQIPGYTGPDLPADFSYRYVSWFERQLSDMEEAGIDICFFDFEGNTNDQYDGPDGPPEPYGENVPDFMYVALRNAVTARENLLTRGKRPPKLAMFYETPTVMYEWVLRQQDSQNGLLLANGGYVPGYYRQWEIDREIFYKYLRDFYSLVPPAHLAAIDGKPLMMVWRTYQTGVEWIGSCDDGFFSYLDQQFGNDFGGLNLFCYMDWQWIDFFPSSIYPPWEKTCKWGYNDGPSSCNKFGPNHNEFGGVTDIVPGFHTAPGREYSESDNRDRENGARYARMWYRALKQTARNKLFIAETWNECIEATGMFRSQEEEDTSIKINKVFSDRLKNSFEYELICPAVPVHREISYFDSAPYTLRLIDASTNTAVWQLEDVFFPNEYFAKKTSSSLKTPESLKKKLSTLNQRDEYLEKKIKESIDFDSRDSYPMCYGMNVCAGDFNGDGYDEVVCAMGPNPYSPQEPWIKIYEAGNDVPLWTIGDVGLGIFDRNFGYNIAAGDIDGDGMDELIVTAGSGGYLDQWSRTKEEVLHPVPGYIAAFDFSTGSPVELFNTEILWGTAHLQHGLNVACGNINGMYTEIYDESSILHKPLLDWIIVAPGAFSTETSELKFYNYNKYTNQISQQTPYNYLNMGNLGLRISCADVALEVNTPPVQQWNIDMNKMQVILGQQCIGYDAAKLGLWRWGQVSGPFWETQVQYGYYKGRDTVSNMYGNNVYFCDPDSNGYFNVLVGNSSTDHMGSDDVRIYDPAFSYNFAHLDNDLLFNTATNVASGRFRYLGPIQPKNSAKMDKLAEKKIAFVRSIGPNPTRGSSFNIYYCNPACENMNLYVYDLAGKLILSDIYQTANTNGTITCNLSKFGVSVTPGIYLYNLKIGQVNCTGKFVVSR